MLLQSLHHVIGRGEGEGEGREGGGEGEEEGGWEKKVNEHVRGGGEEVRVQQ